MRLAILLLLGLIVLTLVVRFTALPRSAGTLLPGYLRFGKHFGTFCLLLVCVILLGSLG